MCQCHKFHLTEGSEFTDHFEMQFSGTKLDIKDTSVVLKTFTFITICALHNAPHRERGTGREMEFSCTFIEERKE